MQAETRRQIEIEVFTDTHVITGRVRTAQGRLSDTLNYELPHVLVLTETTSKPLEKAEEPGVAGGFVHINTMSIAFAVPHGPEPALEERRQFSSFEYVEKERHKAVVRVPPFSFEGYLHLPRGNDVERSLWQLTPSFVPLTDAKVTLKDQGEVTWQRDVVILNRRKAQIMLPDEGDE
jgi:hypothetical protein